MEVSLSELQITTTIPSVTNFYLELTISSYADALNIDPSSLQWALYRSPAEIAFH